MPVAGPYGAPLRVGPLGPRSGRSIMKIGSPSVQLQNPQLYRITGVTRDSSGNPLGGCVVNLYYTPTDVKAATVQSDGSGNYSFMIGPTIACYIVAYLSGAPDVTGSSVNTLVAS